MFSWWWWTGRKLESMGYYAFLAICAFHIALLSVYLLPLILHFFCRQEFYYPHIHAHILKHNNNILVYGKDGLTKKASGKRGLGGKAYRSLLQCSVHQFFLTIFSISPTHVYIHSHLHLRTLWKEQTSTLPTLSKHKTPRLWQSWKWKVEKWWQWWWKYCMYGFGGRRNTKMQQE